MSDLRLQLRPSKQLGAFIVVSHALAMVAPWFSALAWWWSLFLSVVVLVGGWLSWRRYWQNAAKQLNYRDGRWYLLGPAGEEAVALKGEFLVSSWLVILRFVSVSGRVNALVLTPDCAEAEDLRRLRVLLRFGLQPA